MSTMRKLMDIVESVSGPIDDDWFKSGGFEAHKDTSIRDPFELVTEPTEVITREGPVTAQPGEYILTGGQGERWPVTAEFFEREKTDNGDGTCSPRRTVKLVKLADHDGFIMRGDDKLHYHAGRDYIVRHGAGQYAPVKRDIFDKTYVRV